MIDRQVAIARQIVMATDLGVEVERVRGSAWWSFVVDAVAKHHRHHDPPQGWRYGLVAWKRGDVVGVATVGRAVARMLAGVAEVTRVCTWGSSRKRYGAASALLQAAAALEHRVITYTMDF